MKVHRAAQWVALLACALSCDAASSEPPPAKAPEIAVSLPPSPKGVVLAVLQSGDVSLGVDASCAGAGTSPTDSTLGEYLAGFMAELTPAEGTNGIATEVEQVGDGWRCRLMIQRRAGEEVWSWGLEFQLSSTGQVLRDSFRCLGAG